MVRTAIKWTNMRTLEASLHQRLKRCANICKEQEMNEKDATCFIDCSVGDADVDLAPFRQLLAHLRTG